jgi:hypothetical protein
VVGGGKMFGRLCGIRPWTEPLPAHRPSDTTASLPLSPGSPRGLFFLAWKPCPSEPSQPPRRPRDNGAGLPAPSLTAQKSLSLVGPQLGCGPCISEFCSASTPPRQRSGAPGPLTNRPEATQPRGAATRVWALPTPAPLTPFNSLRPCGAPILPVAALAWSGSTTYDPAATPLGPGPLSKASSAFGLGAGRLNRLCLCRPCPGEPSNRLRAPATTERGAGALDDVQLPSTLRGAEPGCRPCRPCLLGGGALQGGGDLFDD